MKFLLSILACLPFLFSHAVARPVTDSICSADIRTVTLTRNDVELEPPIVRLGSNDFLMLRFDLLGDQPAHLRYRITHCDAQWNEDGLEPIEFFSGFEDAPIENYQFSFTTLQPYVNYYQRILSDFAYFTLSGNYLLTVYPQDAPDSVLFVRRIYVTERLIDVELTVGRPITAERIMQDQEVDVVLSADVSNRHLLVPQYLTVVAQQNGRIDNVRTLPFSGYEANGVAYRWNAANIFEGGNCFRYFDISNIRTPMYNVQRIERFDYLQPEGQRTSPWYAFLNPEEDYSQRNYSLRQSLNGGMKVNVWDRERKQIEADYVWINFTLPMPYPFLNGNIYIVGDLTQWQLDEGSRMEWNPRQKAYTKRLFLKQGYYAYQLLFQPVGEASAHTATLEGDHFLTPNTYTVYVYYRYPGERFDRLIAVKRQ